MSRTLLHFPDGRLDIAARELIRAGERVDLPPLVFDCIAYLVIHRDRAVGRDELVSAVWGKPAISDTMLGKAILAARRAVGDTAEAQALIRTVPRFGYHWVGAIREEDDETKPAQASPGPIATDITHTITRRRWPAIAAMTLILVVATGLLVVQRNHAPHDATTKPAATAAQDRPSASSVAVLPVEVLASRDDAWLRLGLMDLIANRLRDSGVAVMSSDSMVGLLRGADADTAHIRNALTLAHPGQRFLATSITRREAVWYAHATLAQISADASDADPVVAARLLADRLLAKLGYQLAPTSSRAHEQPTLDTLLQQTEAARLADDIDTARRLIATASPLLQAAPAVRFRRAQIETRAGNLATARQQLLALLADLPAETEPALRARALASLCSVENQLDHAPEAVDACSAAIELGSAHGAHEAVAIAYNNRAISRSRSREFEAAQADFARARVAFEHEGDMLALVRVDGNEASMLMARGRPADAVPIFAEAERQFLAFGLYNEALIAIVNTIDADLELLRNADALAASERGWAVLPRVADTHMQHQLRRLRAEALAANGRIAEAHAMLEALLGSADPDSEAGLLGLARGSLARIELEAGHPEAALVLSRQAVAGLSTPEDHLRRARAARIEVLALRLLGKGPDATGAAERFRQWGSASGVPGVAFYATLASAETADSAETAAQMCARAGAIADDLHRPALVADAAVSCGDTLIARGELEAAAAVVGRVARYSGTDFACALLEARLYHALRDRPPWQAALSKARALAGERRIPEDIAEFAATPNIAGTTPEQGPN